MAKISLKRLLAKKEVSSILNDLLKVIDTPITIQDIDGKLFIDIDNDTIQPLEKYPVELAGEVIGWVIGGEKASFVASLLSHLLKNELEKKTLARETLDKYKELNLIYNISERITACLDLKEVAKLVIDEARRLISADSGSLMLLNKETGKFEVIAAFGQKNETKAPIEVAKLVSDEARRLISADSGSLMLLNKETGKFEVIAAFGQKNETKAPI